MPFPGPCSPPVATALGYTRKCTEWQIRITTRKSCSIFFFVRLFLHDIFLKFELLARYFFWDSTHPPIKNQMVRPLVGPNNFVKIFNELYLFSISYRFCVVSNSGLSCEFNAFFFVHDSENPKFGSLNTIAVKKCEHTFLLWTFEMRNMIFWELLS